MTQPDSLIPIADQIWRMKYRFSGSDTLPADETVEATWARIADALAEAEAPADRSRWSGEFREALEGFQFLPAGRIVAGAGTGARRHPFQLLRHGRRAGRHGRHLRGAQRSCSHHAEGRRHRI